MFRSICGRVSFTEMLQIVKTACSFKSCFQKAADKHVTNLGASVAADLKHLENMNPAANNVSSEQLCTVTEIKKECFDVKLEIKKGLSKAQQSMMEGGQGM